MKILVTGSDGFVGKNLLQKAISLNYSVCATSRFTQKLPSGVATIGLGSIDENTNWRHVLNGCEVVVHLAARVHVLNDHVADSLAEFRRVNVNATLNLARQAVDAGVRRFVFISSIGVNGAETFGIPFAEDDIPFPHSEYAISKYEAEQCLINLSARTGLEVVIVRPPLIYGPNAPGNFGSLLRWVSTGIPLPFGHICNKRSFISLENMTDFLLCCVRHPAAAGEIFLVSDGEDVSTTELLRRTATAMSMKVSLWPVPVSVLRLGAALLGKSDVAQRLCGSLQINIDKSRRILDWSPPLNLDQGLMRVVEGMKP
jgi:nucleoside-diphosphate-sugar epimerase